MKVETRKCKNVVMRLSLLILIITQFIPACFAVSSDEASDAIKQADRDLGSAFVAVAEAEGAGADVSVFLSKLGSAGDFLSEAYVAFRARDYGNASLFAMECSNAVESVARDGARLKADAEREHSDRLLLTAAWSGVGLVLLLVLGFFGWKFLKRWYFRRILGMKPQVEGEQ